MDSSIELPVVRYRIGPEALLGLLPGVGDLIGAGLSGYLIWLSRRHRAPLGLQARMLGIAILDLLIGAIPIVGDWFDFAHKANARIARLLAEHLRSEPGRCPPRR